MRKNIVVYLSISPEEGGKFQYSITLLEELSKIVNKNITVIACYNDALWEPYIEKFSLQKLKISKKESILHKLLIKLLKELSLFGLIRKVNKISSYLYKQIKNLNPFLVFYPGNDDLAYKFDFPSVIPIHDLMHRYENFPEVKEPKIFKSRERHYKNICKYSKIILVDSEMGKKHAMECYSVSSNKIFIYPYKPPYYVYDYIEVDINSKYNLPEKFLFYPAQFWKHKNHKLIIEATKLLKEKGIIINFVFVGSKKNSYDEVLELIQKYLLQNQFFILGYVSNDELVSIYKKAIALVMPTFFGPTNIPPLEAFYLGCPVLISDVYAHKELFENAAFLFNPNDPLDLATKIELLYFDTKIRNNLIENGKKRINSILSLNYIDKLLNTLLL